MINLKTLATTVCLLLVAAAGCKSDSSSAVGTKVSRVFFVATNGNDGWSGRLPKPNRSKTDGPLLSLSRALDKSRAAGQGGSSEPARIWIGGGNHFLSEPLVITPADSGLQIVALKGQHPVISGGRKLIGWQKTVSNGRELWTVQIPEARDGKWLFRELWVNGKRAVRARHPNKGYLAIAELPDKTAEWTQGQTRFQVGENDLKAWSTLTNAEVVAMTRWVESRLPVINLEGRLLSLGKKSVFQLSPGDLYYVEHALEALDEPGEWYLDGGNGTLYYMPRPEDTLDAVEAFAPVLAQLVRIEGKPEVEKLVEQLRFEGLTFSHSEWYFPKGFQSAKNKPEVSPAPAAEVGGFAQAAIGVPGAVWGEGVRNAVFSNCRFLNLGSYGLELARGCQSNSIVGCEFAQLGAGGVRIGETAIRERPSEQARGNLVSDCRIHDGGKMFHSAIGVWIGQSPANRISHNEIYNFYYTGISIGWTWGYGPALASNNIVEFNSVHHIGVQSDGDGPILSDMGGIYTLGRQPGTLIRNNLWHDIAAKNYGGWGIYFDEGSSGIIAESNLVYRTTHGGFHQHYGQTNIVRNNVFALARDHQVQRTRVEPHPSFSFATNIVYFDSGALLAGDWAGDNYQIDSNVYFDARPGAQPESMRFAGQSLEKWRARGHDLHSVIGDPLFVAPSESNFGLRPNSPAFGLGFKPINLQRIGPRTTDKQGAVME